MGKKNGGFTRASRPEDLNIDLPNFDEKALSKLAENIEKGFNQSKRGPNSAAVSVGYRKLLREKTSKDLRAPETLPSAEAHPIRGTKRNRHGIEKPTLHKATQPINFSSKHSAEKAKYNKDVMLQEILALGGTEEDMNLVADAASDEEDEAVQTDGRSAEKSLQMEVEKFVAGLGIKGRRTPPLREPEEGDAEEEQKDMEEVGNEREPTSVSKVVESTDRIRKISDTQNVAMTAANNSAAPIPGRLVFEARPDWHAAELPSLPFPISDEVKAYSEAIQNLESYASSLLEADSSLYASKHLKSSSSHRFLSTIMTSGTLSDKVSALTLVVQESPVHTSKSFESLLTLAKKRSRGQAVTAIGAIKDLMAVGVVLPSDRRLRTFGAQPGLLGTLQQQSLTSWKFGQKLPGRVTKAHLISWAYEDWLKEAYFEMLKVLEGWCNDEVEYARSRAVTYVYELLKEKPEQESNLLRLLVNKLGDPEKKLASRASYLILQLQTSHPLMKPIIVRSIESELLLRPGQNSHAKYYAINTLNQTILSTKEEEVARKLLEIYFALFVSLLKKPEPLKILPGPIVNRKGQIQGGGGAAGKRAKLKATKEQETKLMNEELREKMISAVLTGVNRALPFSQADDITLDKHMDTLFRITHSSNFNTSIQALMLIEQISTSKHIATDRFYRTLYESLLDPRLITSSKHALFLNLLFRALKSDVNSKRVKAFAKRLLQIVTLHQPPFICGVMYLLKELEAIFPGMRSLYNDPEMDQDDEEIYRDAPEDKFDSKLQLQQPQLLHPERRLDEKVSADAYDSRKRDPEHSNADRTCLWELIPFLTHFHPSVTLFASCLMNNEKMPPKPDLTSHTLTHFLDRFVYRNAKATTGGFRGTSLMQPLAGSQSGAALLSNRSNSRQDPVNSEAFWRKKTEDVAADEVFFHKYFSQIGKLKQISKKDASRKSLGSDDEDENENEDEIWQALIDSRPEVEGPSDDDSNMEMLDIDAGMESSQEGSEDDDQDGAEIGDQVDNFDGLEDEAALFSSDDGSEDDDPEIDELFATELQTNKSSTNGRDEQETSRQKKKRLKNLPTFASADDYAAMLEDNEDEDH